MTPLVPRYATPATRITSIIIIIQKGAHPRPRAILNPMKTSMSETIGFGYPFVKTTYGSKNRKIMNTLRINWAVVSFIPVRSAKYEGISVMDIIKHQ